MPYVLECTDCSFQTVVDGEFGEVVDAIEAHQDANGGDSFVHFVNVHGRD